MPAQLVLTAQEVDDIQALLAVLQRRYANAEDASFLADVDVLAHDLPLRVRQTLRAFRLRIGTIQTRRPAPLARTCSSRSSGRCSAI